MSDEEKNPVRIKTILSGREVPPPDGWDSYINWAAQLGLRIVPVSSVSGVDLGWSPGDVWAFEGTVWVETRVDILATLLHEISHWVVALHKEDGSHLEVNYGNDTPTSTDEEVESCNAQIVWALIHKGPEEADGIATWLQFDSSCTIIREDLHEGLRAWNKRGSNLTLPDDLLATFAKTWDSRKTPEDIWDRWSQEESV